MNIKHPTPQQESILSDEHRFRVLVCGRKFGKTTVAVEELVSCAVEVQDARVFYFAPFYKEAREICWDRLIQRLQGNIVKKNEQRLEVIINNRFGGTSKICLYGWESVESVRGLEADLEVFDEVQNYKRFWSTWQEVLLPTLAPRKGRAVFMGTSKGYNHLYDLHNLESKDERFASFRFTSFDNPFLDHDEINQAKKSISNNAFQQEYMAEFIKREGLVYNDFDRRKHLFKTGLPVIREWYAGVDFGYTNPAAIIIVGRDSDDHFWVTREWYKTHKLNKDIIEYAVSFPNVQAWYPDPAEADRIEEMKRAGLRCLDVQKGPGSIEKGIDDIRTLLQTNRIHVHISCINLINEFEMYAYEDENPDRNAKDTPIDKDNHALDALRYAIMMIIKKQKKPQQVQQPFVDNIRENLWKK
jgi:PBSX family phage terminase large subunit